MPTASYTKITAGIEPFMGSKWLEDKGLTNPVSQNAASLMGETAKQILSTGRLKSAGEPDVFLTNAKDAGYGDGTVLSVNVDPKRLFIDDEFPGGRFYFRLPVTNGQAAISKPKLVSGDETLNLPNSKTVSIPVSQVFLSGFFAF